MKKLSFNGHSTLGRLLIEFRRIILNIKVYAAWSRSGCDSLGKCLPTLLPALSHPASAGEALDAIVSLANKNRGHYTFSSFTVFRRYLIF